MFITQHTVVNVSTLQLQIEVCNKQQQPVSDIIIEIWFSDSLLASFFRTRWKCFHVSGSLVSKLTIYSHPLQESEAVIKHFVLLLFSLKTVKYATQCTAVAVLFKWEMKLMYCEAQARVRQGSARDGSQGKRPQSLNPCLELTSKLGCHLPPPTKV